MWRFKNMTQGDQDVIKDFLSISKYIILGKNKKSKKKGLKKLESIVKNEKFRNEIKANICIYHR